MSLMSMGTTNTTGTLIQTPSIDVKNVEEPINPSTNGLISGVKYYGKPNAIMAYVRPVRRIESIFEMEPTTPLNETNTSTPKATIKPQPNNVNLSKNSKQSEIDSFSKELDFKLKHLQGDKKTSTKNVNFISIFCFSWFFDSIYKYCSVCWDWVSFSGKITFRIDRHFFDFLFFLLFIKCFTILILFCVYFSTGVKTKHVKPHIVCIVYSGGYITFVHFIAFFEYS